VPRRGRGHRRPAFTLVEVLIVVALIALLVAILMPTLNRARELAKAATCRSNLKQIWSCLHAADGLRLPGPYAWIGQVRASGDEAILQCPSRLVETSDASRTVTVGGNVQQMDPPGSVVFDAVESDTIIRVFCEQICHELPSGVVVDISEPGRYTSSFVGTRKVIPAGTAVDCWFVFFDPVGSNSTTSSGHLVMPGDVIGLICDDGTLDDSDDALARTGTQYPRRQPARGFETNAEDITLSPDRRRITIHNFHSSFPGENMRILTAPGGASGYGYNAGVRAAGERPGQLLLVDYDKSVVDLDGIGHDDDVSRWLAPRHLGRANVLCVDGSVRAYLPSELTSDSPLWPAEP